MLQNGIIEPSVSLLASPVVLVKKADKTFRLYIDYRSLDKATIKDNCALPHIQDTLDTLHGNNLFTTLDLLKGCHQIKVEESSCEKIAFTTHVRLWTDQCPCILLTSIGTRPPELHWQVCNPVR